MDIFTTFTPLSRSRFRCNQTRDIVKKRALGAYVRKRVNAGRLKRLGAIPTKHGFYIVLEVAGNYSKFFDKTTYVCPYCSKLHHEPGVVEDDVSCKYCVRTFVVVLV